MYKMIFGSWFLIINKKQYIFNNTNEIYGHSQVCQNKKKITFIKYCPENALQHIKKYHPHALQFLQTNLKANPIIYIPNIFITKSKI